MKKIKIILMVSLLAMIWATTQAQDSGLIYGEVTVITGDKYTGQIRWGNEEAFWEDLFNATKTENPYFRYLNRSEMKENDLVKKFNRMNWNFMTVWDNSFSGPTHAFSCFFGDLKELEITGRDQLLVTLKNNDRIKLTGGSNDVGADISVLDPELGKIDLKWDRIEKIVFSDTPKQLKKKMGDPLYGTVETMNGKKLTGFLQWDHDECLTTDKLDGTSRDGKMAIDFGDIASITSERRGSTVVLRSGREVFLNGSNDVAEGNRGIVVKNPDFGRVLLKWPGFYKVTFLENAKGSGLAYDEFPKPKNLKGSVKTTQGNTYSGRIVYDLDEALDFEMLDGKDDYLEYAIPMRVIKKITPKNYNYATIELKGGERLLLGDGQDVSDRNYGLLVWESEKQDPVYITWNDIEEIIFE